MMLKNKKTCFVVDYYVELKKEKKRSKNKFGLLCPFLLALERCLCVTPSLTLMFTYTPLSCHMTIVTRTGVNQIAEQGLIRNGGLGA